MNSNDESFVAGLFIGIIVTISFTIFYAEVLP